MKRITVYVLFVFFIMTVSLFEAQSEPAVELIEASWEYCGDCVSFYDCDNTCIKSIEFVFFNNTKKYISKISFLLIITDENGNTIYKRNHSININLGAFKQAKSTKIKLIGTVTDNNIPDGDAFFQQIKTVITSIK